MTPKHGQQLRKLSSMTMDNSSSREQLLRNATSEVHKLQQDLDAAIRAKDLAYQENRRIQEDLAACASDCRNAHNDLDIARRQIDDLKRQLQQYVAEVKRTEDLISQKEIERNEMLDHFRSLSQEATVLESNNHSLETEATQTRVQLSLALDHANDLERKLETRDTMIRSYEKQIADMTAQIARMEVQVTQTAKIQEQSEVEVANMRELCVKLDKQKDDLMKQLQEVDGARAQVGREADRLRRESESLHNTLTKDRNSHENLEKLLTQCRQECVDQKLLNQELQAELQRCKSKVEELQIKLFNVPQKARNDDTSESYRHLPSREDVFAPNNFDGAPKSFDTDRRTMNSMDHNRTSSVRRLSFALPSRANPNIPEKHGSVMSPIPESEPESPADSAVQARPNSLSSVHSVRSTSSNNDNKVMTSISESQQHNLIALGNSSGVRTRHNNLDSIRNSHGSLTKTRPESLTNTQHLHDASNYRNRLSIASESFNSNQSGIRTRPNLSNQLQTEFIDDLRSQSITRARAHPSSNVQSTQNASIDSVISANEATSRQLRYIPARSTNANRFTSNQTEGPIANEQSEEKLTEDETTKNLPYTSISAYLGSSLDMLPQEFRANEVLSMLPYVSPSHRLSISSESGRATRDQEQDNPMDDDSFRDKTLRDKSCACLRVCKCHEKFEGGQYRPHSSFGTPVTFSCVFTSSGPPASRYSASYSFAYENLNTTQALQTKMSSEEYNKQ